MFLTRYIHRGEVKIGKRKIIVGKHELIPKHEKLSDREKKSFYEKFNIKTQKELPRISKADPGIQTLSVKQGDIIKITRKSRTAGTSLYYRVVIDA